MIVDASSDDLFIKDIWYVAGWTEEFRAGTPAARSIINEPVVLYRRSDGVLAALADRCPHRWAPLSLGRVEGDELRCMYHGLKFASDGQCTEIPAQERIPKALCVRAYPVIERHRLAWIWMGDPSSADPALIPDLGMLEESHRRVYIGQMDYQANFSLINDNLLDLSHLAFLHETTLGRSAIPDGGALRKPIAQGAHLEKLVDRGLRAERWVLNACAGVAIPRNISKGDLWSRIDYLVPGLFVQKFHIYPPGTAEHCHGSEPASDIPSLSDGMIIYAVTPLSARQTRYFYSFGPRASDMDEEESNEHWRIMQVAFAEDLRMIEAQQRVIDQTSGGRMMALEVDRCVILFRKLMKGLQTSS